MAAFTEDSTSSASAASALTLVVSTLLLSAASALSLVSFDTAGNGVLTSTGRATSYVVSGIQVELSSSGGGATDAVLSVSSTLGTTGTAADQLTSSTTANVVVQERGRGTSWAGPITVADLASSGSSSSELSTLRLSTLDLVSTATATSTAGADGAAATDLRSSGTASSEATGWASLTADLVSSGTATSEVSAPRTMNAWVMDSAHASMVRYTGLPVSSLAWIGGKIVGLGEEGLFIHEGDLDGTRRINAEVLTGETRLGSSMVKSLGNLNVEYVATGSLLCQIKCAMGSFTYELPARGVGTARGSRAITGRGLRSLYWQFRFTNVKGADFTITQATADNAASTNRRI